MSKDNKDKAQEDFNIVRVGNKLKRLTRQELAMVKAGNADQLTVFQEQIINETKNKTTTLRISTDLINRAKRMAKDRKITNHGKLINSMLDQVLIKFGY